MNIPGIKEILAVVNNMPEQFDALITRLDRVATSLDRVVELLEDNNRLLEDANINSRS